MGTREAPEHYCWFDTEFTSLDLDQARLLQVALVVTDQRLAVLPPPAGFDAPPGALRANGIVLDLAAPRGWEPSEFLSTENPGLVQRCLGCQRSAAEVDGILARYLDALLGPPAEERAERPVLAGNSIHCDWLLARRDLPAFSARLHYRLLDASAFKSEWLACYGGETELLDKDDAAAVRAVFPEADIQGTGQHDAYYDAQASLAELAWYRERLGVRA